MANIIVVFFINAIQDNILLIQCRLGVIFLLQKGNLLDFLSQKLVFLGQMLPLEF